MKSRNSKFTVSVGVSSSVFVPVLAVLDIGAGPNLIREDVLPPNWETLRLRGVPIPKVMNASGRLLHSKGVIVLIVQVGHLRTRVRFYVTAGLAVPCILGCNFINRHVKSILTGDRRVELQDWGSVAISGTSPRNIDPPGNTPTTNMTPSTKVQVAKAVQIPPRSEAHVTVQTASTGLRFLQSKASTVDSLGITMANRIAEMQPHVPLRVRVINLFAEAQLLKKDMVLGFALPRPTMVFTLPDSEGHPTAPAGKPDFAHTDAMADDSWREKVALGHLSERDKEKVLGILSKHRAMWDGHLGVECGSVTLLSLVLSIRVMLEIFVETTA
jgi:hypothetical protein